MDATISAAIKMNLSFAAAPPHVVHPIMPTNVLPGFRVMVMIWHHGLADNDESYGHDNRKRCNLDHGRPPSMFTRDCH